MKILLKSIFLFFFYTYCSIYVIGLDDFRHWRIFVTLTTIYFAIFTFPKSSLAYQYDVVELKIPRYAYMYRCGFHYVLFYTCPLQQYLSVFCVIVLMFWKDIYFLITHAERRLGQIDKVLHEEKNHRRLTNLHYNVYTDDINNRFHEHAFDTNKIYFENDTFSSDKISLALYNYRLMRKEKRKPRIKSRDETVWFEASSNRLIFISNRFVFIATPLFVLLSLFIIMLRHANQRANVLSALITNHSILALDICFYYTVPKLHADVLIDVMYACGTFIRIFWT